MERLTHKKEDWYWKDEEFWLSAENPSLEKADEIYYKLAQFEDFMEEHRFKSLEELEYLIGYPVFEDGYDEQDNEINKIEFTTYKKSFEETFDKNKKLKQENQALKDRWEKLKEYVADNLEITQACQDPIEQEEYWCLIGAENCYKNLQEKIQELEG